jgi:hypothetical protein
VKTRLLPLALVLAMVGCDSAPGGAASTVDSAPTGAASDRTVPVGVGSLGAASAGTGSTVRLSAQLTSPVNVVLRWTATDTDAAGRTVEYTDQQGGQFVVLQFVAPAVATYQHQDLMPEATFYYRVRSYFGPASAPVTVDLPPGDYDDAAHDNEPDWAAPSTRPQPSAARASIRSGASVAAAAPTDLHETIRDPNGIEFTWTDNATDEEGYLLEVKAAGATDFSVAAELDPDVNTYGLVTLPTEKHAQYRVRAFYFGQSSNVVHETTGKDPNG